MTTNADRLDEKQAPNGFFKRYSKYIISASVLVVVVVTLFSLWNTGNEDQSIARNLKAVATIIAFDRQQQPTGQGSGFFVNSTGLLVTNAHVVRGMAFAQAKLSSGAFYNLREIRSIDSFRDVAVLQFDAKESPSIRGLGNSDGVHVGENVYAIGTPNMMESTVSKGNISNANQEVNGQKFIQFTAPISPGSSGGGLFDEKGFVIGITSASKNIPTGPQKGLAQNLNFAVPINDVRNALTGNEKSLKSSAIFYFAQATMANNRKDWGEAIRNYSRTIELDSTYADAYIGLGDVYFAKGEYQSELESYYVAAMMDTNDAHYQYALASAYEDVEEYDKATEAFLKAFRLDPNNKELIHDFALLCLARRNKVAATSLIEKLARLDPGWGRVLQSILNNTK